MEYDIVCRLGLAFGRLVFSVYCFLLEPRTVNLEAFSVGLPSFFILFCQDPQPPKGG